MAENDSILKQLDDGLGINMNNTKLHTMEYAFQVSDMMSCSKSVALIIIVVGLGVAFRTACNSLRSLRAAYYPAVLLAGFVGGLVVWSSPGADVFSIRGLEGVNPHIYLLLFFPVLLFHTAFSMDYQGFGNNTRQVLLITLIGFPIQVGFLAFIFKSALTMGDTKWTWEVAFVFSIVVCIIESDHVLDELNKTQGRVKYLQLLLQGEQLLTLAIATYCYYIVFQYYFQAHETYIFFLLTILWHLLGLVFGLVFGVILDYLFVHIPNDCLSAALTLTIFTAYFSFFVGHAYMEFSGVLATITTGVILSPTKIKTSTTVEANIAYFWSWLSYSFTTVSYIIPGIDIGLDPAFISIKDVIFVLIIYIITACARCMMYGISRPALNRLGHYLKWSDIFIMVTGPYTAAPPLIIALLYKEYSPGFGHQVLTYMGMLCVLSTLFNSFSLPALLNLLHIYDLTHARAINMRNAIRHVVESRNRAILSLKMDRVLAGANWAMVSNRTNLAYGEITLRRNEEGMSDLRLPELMSSARHAIFDDGAISFSTTTKDTSDLEHEARQRILNVQQVSLWKQYHAGILSKKSMRTLSSRLQGVVDDMDTKIKVEDMELSYVTPEWINNIKKFLQCLIKHIPKPYYVYTRTRRWKIFLLNMFNHLAYRFTSTILVLIDTLLILNMALHHYWPQEVRVPFTILQALNYFFYSVFLIEFTLLLMALGYQDYFGSKFIQTDFTCNVIVRSLDIMKSMGGPSEVEQQASDSFALQLTKYVLLLRLNRCHVILEVILIKLIEMIEVRMNRMLFQRYDIGKGLLMASDQTLKYLRQIVPDKNLQTKLRKEIEEDKKKLSKALGLIQKERPNVAVTVKTRHAIKQVINAMNDSINDIYDEGLLDDIEKKYLIQVIQNAKKTVRSLKLISPCSPEYILKDVPWLQGECDMAAFILEHAKLHSFSYDEVIIDVGDDPAGIFILVSGLVKCVYRPFSSTIQNLKKNGVLPNCDFLVSPKLAEPQEDYIVSGNVIGEIGAVTGRRSDMTVICESEVQVYYIPRHRVFKALFGMDTSANVYSKVWRSIGIKIALLIIQYEPTFQGWLKEKTLLYLEKAFVPNLKGVEELFVNDLVADIILIEGKVKDGNNDKVMIAPLHIPRTISKLVLPGTSKWAEDELYETKLLIIPSKHADEASILSTQGILRESLTGVKQNNANIELRNRSLSGQRCLKNEGRDQFMYNSKSMEE